MTHDLASRRRRTTRRIRRTGVALTLVFFAAAGLGAQAPAPQSPRLAKVNPIEERLFPPELVMRHQEAIALRGEQREALIAEVQQLQSDVVPLQFELSEATEKLAQLLGGSRIDEARALAQVDQIQSVEAQVKKRHLTLLIRIKNLLTDEQQGKLEELRRSSW